MEEKKYGEEGMLCLSGKLVFKEYYKNPQLTDDAKFTDKDGKIVFNGTTNDEVKKQVKSFRKAQTWLINYCSKNTFQTQINFRVPCLLGVV